MPDAPWPGLAGVERASAKVCLPLFRDYMGVNPSELTGELASYGLTPAGWASGDRVVICRVEFADDVTDSMSAG